jgi:hypothetical protein
MKSFKELREDTLFLEYSTMMENHPFNEFTTEELLDIVLDDDIYEGHRFNALYVLSNSREEELNETYELEEGIGALLGLGGAAFKLAKSPALRAAAQKGLAAGKSVISKGWEKAKGLFGKKPSGKTPETAPKPSARRPSLQPPEAPEKAPVAPKTKLSLGKTVLKYGAPTAAAAYLYNKATGKPAEAGVTDSSKGMSKGSSAMDKPVSPGGMSSRDIHKGIADLAGEDPETKAAVKTLSTINKPSAVAKPDSFSKAAEKLRSTAASSDAATAAMKSASSKLDKLIARK